MKYRKNILLRYMSLAPIALAFERYLECQIYLNQKLEHPILDLGCGEGLFAHILFDDKIDTGIDPNPHELERAHQLDAYNELINCYGNAIPKPDGSYQTIFSNSVLEHITDLEPVLDEVHRLLANGGRFYFTVPSQYFEQYSIISRFLRLLGLIKLAERYQVFYNSFWKQKNCFTLKNWQNLIQKHRFDIIEAYSYNPARICSLNDALVLLSIPAYFIKMISNRWVLFPSFGDYTSMLFTHWPKIILMGEKELIKVG